MLRLWTEFQSRFIADEEGASLVEYALLVALIAVVALIAIVLLGNNVSSKMGTAAEVIGT